MSNVKGTEGRPLMEEPQLVPGQEPGLSPPPFSSLFGSQSQAYASVPSAPVQTPYPVQGPQDSTVYNPMSQATMDCGNPMSSPYGTPYTSTTYDPMANVPPVNQTAMPNQTVNSSRSPNSSSKARRCRCLKIFTTIGIILIGLFGAALRSSRKSQFDKESINEMLESFDKRMNVYPKHDYHEAINREVNAMLMEHNSNSQSQYNGRKKRMVLQEETEYFKDYDFLDYNDQPLIEKSYRHQRDTSNKIEFGSRKNKLNTLKKRVYKAKKFIR